MERPRSQKGVTSVTKWSGGSRSGGGARRLAAVGHEIEPSLPTCLQFPLRQPINSGGKLPHSHDTADREIRRESSH
jgi:hypothetical protein